MVTILLVTVCGGGKASHQGGVIEFSLLVFLIIILVMHDCIMGKG